MTEGRVLSRALGLLRRRPEIRGVVVVNALWELSVSAMKTFGILFAIVGLGLAPEEVPLSVGLIAVGVVAGALIAGQLADRYGAYRLLRIVVWPYGLGLLAPFLSQSSERARGRDAARRVRRRRGHHARLRRPRPRRAEGRARRRLGALRPQPRGRRPARAAARRASRSRCSSRR